jgi:hypothetical protein
MEPKGPIPSSQEFTGPYNESDESCHTFLPYLFNINFNIILPLCNLSQHFIS